MHYLLIGQRKPDGQVYANTEAEWKWLNDRVSKAARWLGHVPFTQIIDQRNAEPDPRAGGHLDLPAAEKELPETAHRLRNVTACGAVPLLIRFLHGSRLTTDHDGRPSGPG